MDLGQGDTTKKINKIHCILQTGNKFLQIRGESYVLLCKTTPRERHGRLVSSASYTAAVFSCGYVHPLKRGAVGRNGDEEEWSEEGIKRSEFWGAGCQHAPTSSSNAPGCSALPSSRAPPYCEARDPPRFLSCVRPRTHLRHVFTLTTPPNILGGHITSEQVLAMDSANAPHGRCCAYRAREPQALGLVQIRTCTCQEYSSNGSKQWNVLSIAPVWW
ncbi:hypothetical protein K438DRAFT_1774861 [Mycena galopus ATCC 62051]|nr:hypothetical protein K438DRAFT_1774861 [Mycena galopus ATCC 62051]